MKITIDFQVLETKDPKRILVSDFSEWQHIDKEQSSIRVLAPGKTESIDLPFRKNAINGLNSINLDLGCTADGGFKDLPDGIYKLTVLGCPDKFQKTRYYLQTDIAQGKLDKLYTTVGHDCNNVDKVKRDKLLNLTYLLETAKAATRKGDVSLAEDFFECALKDINKYLECDNCL